MIGSVTSRFLCKVRKTSSCWFWLGAISNTGYGMLHPEKSSKKKMVYAHRFSYETYKGPIKPGLDIDHLCRVRNCVNPKHLEAVTRRTNILRGRGCCATNASKIYCLNGHPLSGVNLYMRNGGGRQCKACFRIRYRKHFNFKRRHRAGPLRKIEKIIRRASHHTDLVLLECGHKGISYGFKRARCSQCDKLEFSAIKRRFAVEGIAKVGNTESLV